MRRVRKTIAVRIKKRDGDAAKITPQKETPKIVTISCAPKSRNSRVAELPPKTVERMVFRLSPKFGGKLKRLGEKK